MQKRTTPFPYEVSLIMLTGYNGYRSEVVRVWQTLLIPLLGS